MQDQDKIDHEAISNRQAAKCRSESIDLFALESSLAEANVLLKSSPFFKFVLTGGPCGGKTTSLARLSSYLRERGFEVMTAPEAFTILAGNGFRMDYFSVDGMPKCVQNTVMDMQITIEDSFERILRAKGKPGVLLCDRGLMDGAAYMDPHDWEEFLRKRNTSAAEIREGRYNAVFHLVTAADGAEAYYTLENNEARTETAEEARSLDCLTRKAWVGHPKLFVLDNSTDFEGKLNKLVDIVTDLVGLPNTSKKKTFKFLLDSVPDLNTFPEDVNYQLFEVEKVYLYEEKKDTGTYANEYSFIRKRTHLSKDCNSLGSSYGLTTVHVTHSGKEVEVKRIITPREYNAAYKTRDPTRHVVKQRRITFLWATQSFNVHIYKEPIDDLCILHVQSSVGSDKCEVPHFLSVNRLLGEKEEDKQYGAFFLSKRTN